MTNSKIKYRPVDPAVASLVARHDNQPEAIIEILTELQADHGSLTREAILDVSRLLKIPAEKAFGVASFYSMLRISDEETPPPSKRTIHVCDGPVCWLHGAARLHKAIQTACLAAEGTGTNGGNRPDVWSVERSSCLGLCDRAPAALLDMQQAGPLTPTDAERFLTGYLAIPPDYSNPRPGELRVMMANAGVVNPDSIDSALEHGAYQGLTRALAMEPGTVLETVEASGLTGRGGAGFPVGRKWRFVVQAQRTPKYIICNADESEPLIFKDRVLMDTDPHLILEGMAIAGYACGANEAFIYIRGEYVSQADRLERAIRQAEERYWLGEHIQDSTFSFHIHVHRGAGAYICGEETALIESLEGKRGEPRVRPPYPPSYGYKGLPTVVNNVESYSSVPSILRNGAEWYRSLSNYTTPGTKMYMLLGHVNQPGLFEAPFGLTLRQVIEEYGGGMRSGSRFHLALTGGAAGTIVSSEQLDTPIDYASGARGISLGAGAFLVCDQSVSPVDLLRELLHFFAIESCGKCTPCRIGTRQTLHILEDLSAHKGKHGDVDRLHQLADVLQNASFCGLGQAVPIPMRSALANFKDDFLAGEVSPSS